MSETDLLRDAVAELYSADPDQFVERRRQADLAAAEQAADEAAQLAGRATAAEHELERTVQTLEEQLADARSSLADTRNQARRARNRQRQTSQALDRLRG